MKVKLFLLLLTCALGLFHSCRKKELCCDQFQGNYSKGVFVVNEGPWGGSGTISWYNPATGETQDSIYEKANQGAELGQFVQSLTFFGGKAYIVVNGINKVVVVDAQTFKFLDTIGGLAQPRYFLPLNVDLAYVSQWGNDGFSGSLAKVNLLTNQVEAVVPVGRGPEKMIYANGAIYVANSGGYGTDSTIAVVEPFNALVLHKFASSGLNPATLTLNAYGLFALCKGNYDPINPAGAWLSDLGPTTFGVSVPGGSDDLVSTPDGTSLYFAGGGSIWEYSNNTLHKVLDQPAYGFALDTVQNLFYCADDKGFTGAGEVVIYSANGNRLKSFRTGIGPGEIVIRN